MDKSDDNGLCDYKELDDTYTVHTGACFIWRIWARWRMMVQVWDIPTGLTQNVGDGIVQRFTSIVCASSKRNDRRSNLSHKCVKSILYFVYLNDMISDSVFHVRWFC